MELPAITSKWLRKFKWVKMRPDGRLGCKFCNYVLSEPTAFKLRQHGRTDGHRLRTGQCQGVDNAPPVADFQSVLSEKLTRGFDNKAALGPVKTRKIVWCLNEAILDGWRRAIAKSLSTAIMQDGRGSTLSVRFACRCKPVSKPSRTLTYDNDN